MDRATPNLRRSLQAMAQPCAFGDGRYWARTSVPSLSSWCSHLAAWRRHPGNAISQAGLRAHSAPRSAWLRGRLFERLCRDCAAGDSRCHVRRRVRHAGADTRRRPGCRGPSGPSQRRASWGRGQDPWMPSLAPDELEAFLAAPRICRVASLTEDALPMWCMDTSTMPRRSCNACSVCSVAP